jgi:DNA-binding transcriptional MocR family regulator
MPLYRLAWCASVLHALLRKAAPARTMQTMSARDASGPETATLVHDAPLSAPGAHAGEAAPRLYLQIALRLAQMVASGALPAGQRLPSVRDSAAQNNVSVATVVQALATLEEHRLVQPRARSGYFVAPASKAKAAALVCKIRREPELPKAQTCSANAEAGVAPRPLVSFAGYAPKDKDFFDTDRIRVALSRATRLKRDTLAEYSSSVGTLALRNAVALPALQLALDTQPIKALLLVPTLSNPLAAVMPLTQKRALARLPMRYWNTPWPIC